MMKTKKLIAMAMTLCLFGACAMFGCTGGKKTDSGIDLDPDKEVINVSLFTAGYGSDWLVNYINDYNARHSDGKYQFNRTAENVDSVGQITDQIKAGLRRADIFFTDTPNIKQLIGMNVLLDLSPVWGAKPVKDGAPGETIRDNILDSDLYENVFGDGNAVYGLPYTQGIGGIIYDYDFMSQYDMLFKDGTTENGLTKGRDGKEGTYDDGLPITVEDFKNLCDTLKAATYLPFLYSDRVNMESSTLDAIHYLYEGEENFMTLATFNGKYTTVENEEIEITPETGYLAWSEDTFEGKSKAIDFASDILLGDKYYYSQPVGDHIASEQQFLYSHNTQRAAMTINGSWWEFEARPAFKSDEQRHGAAWGYGKREFRMMPAPIPDMEVAQKRGTADKAVYIAQNDGAVFALRSDDAEKNAAIIEFLIDYASGYGSEFFSASCSCMLAYDYHLSDETLAAMTPFGRNLYEILQSDNTIVRRMDLISYLEPLNYLATGSNVPKKWATKSADGKTIYSAIAPALRAAENNKETVKNSLQNYYSAAEWANIYSIVGA